jgi:ferredoxin-NADP reductase
VTSSWIPATLVDAWRETPESRTLVLDAALERALAGQHIDIRLTADDGYTAQRSYSLGSPAGAERFQVTVDRLEHGEVSPYLVDGLEVGHRVEVRGPVGRWFVWEPAQTEPIQLLAGGSGIVPLMSMIRTRELAGGTAPMRLLYSIRTPGDRFFTRELDDLAARGRVDLRYVFTREVPDDWPARAGRITPALLAESTLPAADQPTIYVCGPTGFVEAATAPLMRFGHEASRIKTERFGPTG